MGLREHLPQQLLQHLPRHQPLLPRARPALLQLPLQALWVNGDPATPACPFLPASQLVPPAVEQELIPHGNVRCHWRCQLPCHFLRDVRDHSADRGVIIQQLRHVGEARAGFSFLQRRKEARQGRAGHSRCPLPPFPLLPIRQEQLSCLRKLTFWDADLALLGPKLGMGTWHFLQHCKTLYKPLLRCKAALQRMVLPSGLPARWEVVVWEERNMQHIFLVVGKGSPVRAHQSVPLQNHAGGGGDAALRTSTHGGNTPLQEPRHLGELLLGLTGTAQQC